MDIYRIDKNFYEQFQFHLDKVRAQKKRYLQSQYINNTNILKITKNIYL